MSFMELVKKETAPRPLRRSFSRSMYDALDSLKGPATVEQVISMLPATDDADKWQTSTPDRVTQLLKSAEAHGYVQFNGVTTRWGIASKAWYEKQQKHIAELRLQTDKERLGEPDLKPGPIVRGPLPGAPSITFTPKVVLAFLGIGWACGVVTALAYIGLRSIGGV